MKHIYPLILLAAFISWMASCKKEDPEPVKTTTTDTTFTGGENISNIPAITFVSITPATAVEYIDSIAITISYTDGNGDLGENDPNVKNLFMTDSRNNVTYQYRIPQLAPDTTVTITGNFVIDLPSTAITDGSTSQQVSYSIYAVDRGGNESNTVTTSAITITQ